MSNPLFFREALVEYHVKTAQPGKPKRFNSYATKPQNQDGRKGMKN